MDINTASVKSEYGIEKLAERFDKSLSILKKKITMHEIAQHIGISAGFLSRYKKPDVYGLNAESYELIFEKIDELIFVNSNRVWDERTREYIIPEIESTISENLNFDHRTVGLNGQWKGFSWNREKTILSDEHVQARPQDVFNVFLLNIYGKGLVKCKIEKTEMNGSIAYVGEKTISITLGSFGRKLVMFGRVGLRDDLSTLRNINLAYIDTGDKFVKCGLAIVNKGDHEEGKPGNISVDFIDDLYVNEKEYLMGTQLLAPEFDF